METALSAANHVNQITAHVEALCAVAETVRRAQGHVNQLIVNAGAASAAAATAQHAGSRANPPIVLAVAASAVVETARLVESPANLPIVLVGAQIVVVVQRPHVKVLVNLRTANAMGPSLMPAVVLPVTHVEKHPVIHLPAVARMWEMVAPARRKMIAVAIVVRAVVGGRLAAALPATNAPRFAMNVPAQEKEQDRVLALIPLNAP